MYTGNMCMYDGNIILVAIHLGYITVTLFITKNITSILNPSYIYDEATG